MTRKLGRRSRELGAPAPEREQLLERRLKELQVSLVELQSTFTGAQLDALGANDVQAVQVLEALRGDLSAPYGRALSASTALAGAIRWDTEAGSATS